MSDSPKDSELEPQSETRDGGSAHMEVERDNERPAQSAQLGSLSAEFRLSERRKRAVTVGIVALVVVILSSAVGSVSYVLTRAGKSTPGSTMVPATSSTSTTQSATSPMGILTCDPMGIWNLVTARNTATSCLVARAAAREIDKPQEGKYSFEDPMNGDQLTITCSSIKGSHKGLLCRGTGGISLSLKDPNRTPTQEDNLPLFTTVVNIFTRRSETSTPSLSPLEPTGSQTTRVHGTSSRKSQTKSPSEPTTADMVEVTPVDSNIPMESFIPAEPTPTYSSTADMYSSAESVENNSGQQSYETTYSQYNPEDSPSSYSDSSDTDS